MRGGERREGGGGEIGDRMRARERSALSALLSTYRDYSGLDRILRTFTGEREEGKKAESAATKCTKLRRLTKNRHLATRPAKCKRDSVCFKLRSCRAKQRTTPVVAEGRGGRSGACEGVKGIEL